MFRFLGLVMVFLALFLLPSHVQAQNSSEWVCFEQSNFATIAFFPIHCEFPVTNARLTAIDIQASGFGCAGSDCSWGVLADFNDSCGWFRGNTGVSYIPCTDLSIRDFYAERARFSHLKIVYIYSVFVGLDSSGGWLAGSVTHGTVAFVVLFVYLMAGFVGNKMSGYQITGLGVLICNMFYFSIDAWSIPAVASFNLLSFVVFVAIHNSDYFMKAFKG